MSTTGTGAVFLDRDGILNQLVARDGRWVSPRWRTEFRLFDEAPAAVARLKASGWRVFVVTNQPDIARGLMDPAELEAMHVFLQAAVAAEEVAVCPHDDAAACECRKPAPGLLVDVSLRHGVDLRRSFVVGDSWRDVEAGRRAGCWTIGVARVGTEELLAHWVARTLSEAVALIQAASTNWRG